MIGRLKNMITRGVVSLVDPARMMQALQLRLTAGEIKDAMEHFEPYGYTSHPLPGAEGLAMFLGGDRSHGVVVCVADRRYRLVSLQAGEVALYDDLGNLIVLGRESIRVVAVQHLEATAPTAVFNCSTSVTLNTPKVLATGDIEAAGQIRDAVGTMQSMRETFNGHDHPGDSGGTTGQPNQFMG